MKGLLNQIIGLTIFVFSQEKEGEKKSKKGLGLGLLKHKHSSGKLVQYLDKKDAQVSTT